MIHCSKRVEFNIVFILLENRGKLDDINSDENFRKNKPNKAVLTHSTDTNKRLITLLIL